MTSRAWCFRPPRATPSKPRYAQVIGCSAWSMPCWTFRGLESVRSIPDREDIDLASVTADVVEGFRPAAEGRLNLRVDIPDEPLRAYVDRTMWTTIVTNLVNNALKFTPDGEVAVSLSGDDSQVVLTVADTGIGIPHDEQAQIFERFHRGTAGDQQPGSGIGLALVADMTAAHGGTVEVDSEPGVGSRFVVRLPRYNGSQVRPGG